MYTLIMFLPMKSFVILYQTDSTPCACMAFLCTVTSDSAFNGSGFTPDFCVECIHIFFIFIAFFLFVHNFYYLFVVFVACCVMCFVYLLSVCAAVLWRRWTRWRPLERQALSTWRSCPGGSMTPALTPTTLLTLTLSTCWGSVCHCFTSDVDMKPVL